MSKKKWDTVKSDVLLKLCFLFFLSAPPLFSFEYYAVAPLYNVYQGEIKNEKISVGFFNVNFKYSETVDGNEVSSDSDEKFRSVKIRYENNINSFWKFTFQSEYMFGTDTYKGYLYNPDKGTLKLTFEGDGEFLLPPPPPPKPVDNPVYEEKTNSNSNILESEFFGGFYLYNKNSVYLTLNAGAGYRYWKRGYDSNDPNDYKEIYKWGYYLAGTEAGIFFNNGVYAKIIINYKRAVNPVLTAYKGGQYTFNLGKTDGYGGSLILYYPLSNAVGISFEYSKETWNSAKSNVLTLSDGKDYYEPDSSFTSSSGGINFYYQF